MLSHVALGALGWSYVKARVCIHQTKYVANGAVTCLVPYITETDKDIRTLKFGILNRVFADISVAPSKATLTISDSIETASPVEIE